jgi:hypothetical protein
MSMAAVLRFGFLDFDAGVFDRADIDAARLFAIAFGAFRGVDDESVALHANGGVGTFEFAGPAGRALGSDDLESHFYLLGLMGADQAFSRAVAACLAK